MDILKETNYDNYENLNSSKYRIDELFSSEKEKYIIEYCISKGWSNSSLTNEQLQEIQNSYGFKNIGKING